MSARQQATLHTGLRTETSALRDVVGAMVGRMDQLVDCQNALQRQVLFLFAACYVLADDGSACCLLLHRRQVVCA